MWPFGTKRNDRKPDSRRPRTNSAGYSPDDDDTVADTSWQTVSTFAAVDSTVAPDDCNMSSSAASDSGSCSSDN